VIDNGKIQTEQVIFYLAKTDQARARGTPAPRLFALSENRQVSQ